MTPKMKKGAKKTQDRSKFKMENLNQGAKDSREVSD